jgi:RHS repeat-associated protein
MNTPMNRRTMMISNFRRSRLMRLATKAAMVAHVMAATPVLAQDLTQATAKASAKLAGDVTTVVTQTAERAVRKTRRLANDAQRKVRNATVRVNRTVPKISPPVLEVAFGVEVTTEMIARARIFEEPLMPVGKPSADENRALGQLLQTIAPMSRDEQARRVDAFVQDHPTSPWKPSLLANAGAAYAQEGYFSRAAASWRQAWELTRDLTEPGPRATADFAIGAWLTQVTDFGQLDQIGTLLSQVQGRDVRGAASAKVGNAREALKTLSENHDMATFSGPEALKAYLAVVPTRDAESSRKTIVRYHPSVSGTTLADVQHLAKAASMNLEMVHLAPIGDIPVPSIVHLRSQHYSAIVGERNGRYVIRDPGLGGERLFTADAIRDESTGYFLIDRSTVDAFDARVVESREAVKVLGFCAPGGPGHYDPCNCEENRGPGPGGMTNYTFHPQKVSLVLNDVPVGYTPPVGPAIDFRLSYDHRESRLPQTIDFGSVGPMWSHNWLSYVTEGQMSVFLRGQGMEFFINVTAAWLSRAELVPVSTTDTPRYERRLPDGTVEVFTFPDRPASHPGRRIFLTEVIDPQGHSVELDYDSSFRLVSITDAIGQVTTVHYLDSGHPLRVTKVTDPFGRYATMAYDSTGRLISITDVMGMTSSFSYGDGDFIASLTTPYGTTTFRHEAQFADRRIEATDPAGGTERLEYYVTHSSMPTTVDSSDVPTGFSGHNTDMHKYNTLYWDKLAMAAGPTLANATITGRIVMWESFGGTGKARMVPHSIKRPLESRVWYMYANQASSHGAGTTTLPIKIGRVLEGGGSQITEMTYNAKGMVTSRIDPVGRQTNYTYASNGLDLLQVEQVRSGGTDVIQQYADYTSQHVPETITDAAGQDTEITYNSVGQPLTVTNAKSETTTYDYDTNGYLESVTGPVSGATTTYTYDAYGRVESVEDADGYVVVTDYDHLNRVTQRTFPDDSTETNTYSRLDLVEQKDRLGRITRHFYDGFGRRVATRDPAGRTVSQVWCDCGAMEALVDGNGNRTRWERDVQGRVTREVRADNTTDTLYSYETSGRLKTITDPKDQVTTHSYYADDSLSGTAYTDEDIETPNVSYTYDAYYSRVATMVDGIGTTSYTYKSPSTNGAGQVATVDGPLSNDTIAYSYDELGRVIQRTINGTANQVDWTFDALGRVTSEDNLLGEFTYTYHGVTNRLNTVTYPNDQTSTYSYMDDENDHRLQTIHHKYPNAATLSKFDYTYDAAGNILTWRQQADSTAVMWKYRYDPADQLTAAVKHATDGPETVLKRYAYAYDPAGNRTVEQIDDAVMLSAYDNLNRLMSQAPGGPMVVAGSLNETGTVTISGVPAAVDANNNFRGTVPTASGTNTFTVVAKDASGNTTTKTYEVNVAGSTKTFTYDANGNLTADGAVSFSWNARNQLTAVSSAGNVTALSYDGEGRWTRIVENEGGVPVNDLRQIWCRTELCEERNTSATRRRFTSGDQLSGATQLHFRDHLGSLRSITDASAALTAQYSFDPWGRRTIDAGTSASSLAFTGLQKDTLSGVLFSVFRPYHAEQGRWLAQDPIGLSAGPNLYAYVNGRITTDRDPLGLFPFGLIITWTLRAAAIYFFVNGCIGGMLCWRAWDACSAEAPQCARNLAANIMSPQYQQRIEICWHSNFHCQMMRAHCPEALVNFLMPRPNRL